MAGSNISIESAIIMQLHRNCHLGSKSTEAKIPSARLDNPATLELKFRQRLALSARGRRGDGMELYTQVCFVVQDC
jgi:hypothetical protein